jgi:hypothetical protein
MASVTHVLSPVTYVFALIAPVFSAVTHILTPVAAIFTAVDPILDSVEHAARCILLRRHGLLRRRGRRDQQQRGRKGKESDVQLSHVVSSVGYEVRAPFSPSLEYDADRDGIVKRCGATSSPLVPQGTSAS